MKTLNWQLNGIPAYTDGELFDELFTVGGGLYDETVTETSLMHLVNNTTAEAFLAYCGALEAAGFRLGFSRDAEHGIFREYLGGETLVYAYFMKRCGQARIILDRASCSMAAFADGAPAEDTRDDSELMQFGLFYGDPPIRGRVSTCGMLYAVRLHNNQLFLVDGGEGAQCTNEAFAELMLRLRELTQTGDGEPITVACWFCTHAHNDHMDLFINFMRRYADVIKVERILYNFPHYDYIGLPPEHYDRFVNDYMRAVTGALREYCPGARFIKAHTGQLFRFSNMTVDILETHEDMIYENEDHRYLMGLNTSSTIAKLDFDGSSCIILGDADEPNGDVLRKYYAPEELACTYLQAAHHLANRDENIYSYVRAESVMIPQSRLRIHLIRRENYGVLCRYYDRDRFYLAADYTVIFRGRDGKEEVRYYQQQGGPFDPARDAENLWRKRPSFE